MKINKIIYCTSLFAFYNILCFKYIALTKKKKKYILPPLTIKEIKI